MEGINGSKNMQKLRLFLKFIKKVEGVEAKAKTLCHKNICLGLCNILCNK